MKNPPPTVDWLGHVAGPVTATMGGRRSRCQPRPQNNEETYGTRTRVELIKRDAELAEAREELRFNLAVDGVVDALVRRRLDVAVCAADAHHLGDFPPARPWPIKVEVRKRGERRYIRGRTT